MIFNEVYMDGFGTFNQFHIKKLHPGLTIILGNNEAGKSTIMNFIKRMLFGFPDKRSNLNLYPPLNGGRHGGRLMVSVDNEPYIIERYSEDKNALQVILQDGSIGSFAELHRLTGSINKEVYENIFAFGLDELQNFQTLNNDSIKEQLYSAGKGIGQFSLGDLQKEIDKQMGLLFKPSGSKPEINAMLKEINIFNQQIHEIEKDANRHEELNDELERTASAIKTSENERKKLMVQKHTYDQIKNTWEDWQKLKELQHELSQTKEYTEFPEDGLANLEKKQQEICSIEKTIEQFHQKNVKNEREKEKLFISPLLLEQKDSIYEIQKGLKQYEKAVIDLPRLESNLKNEKNGLNLCLQEIGEEWDLEKALSMDISFQNKDFIKQFQQKKLSLKEKNQNFHLELNAIEKEIYRLEDEIQEKKESLLDLSIEKKENETLKEKEKLLFQLKMNLVHLKENETELHRMIEREELVKLSSSSEKTLENKPLIMIFSGLIAVLSITMALIFFTRSDFLFGVLAFVAFFSSLGLMFMMRQKKSSNLEHKQSDADKIAISAEERIKNQQDKVDRLVTLLKENAKELRFHKIPEIEEVESYQHALQEELHQQKIAQELEITIAKLKKSLEKIYSDRDKIMQEIEKIEIEQNNADKEWQTFLTRHSLREKLLPDSVNEIFSNIRLIHEKKNTIDEYQDRIKQVKDCIKDFEARFFDLMEKMNKKVEKSMMIPDLEILSRELNETLKNYELFQKISSDQNEIKNELEQLKLNKEKIYQSLQDLIDGVHADGVEDFIQKGKSHERYQWLKEQISGIKNTIKRICGEHEAYEKFILQYPDTFEELTAKEIDLQHAIDHNEEQLNLLKTQEGKLLKEIEQIEKKEEGSALRLKKTVKESELQNLSRRWSSLVVAKTLMRKAIVLYEREKQPNVMKEAQKYFSLMTLGKYVNIFAPIDESKIYIEDEQHQRKEGNELSKGTAEQLYLSLRFGFIREFSKKSRPLPIIFDDVFVNFDPVRFDATCKAVKELADYHQILYFTCHSDTAEKLHKMDTDSLFIKLQ